MYDDDEILSGLYGDIWYLLARRDKFSLTKQSC